MPPTTAGTMISCSAIIYVILHTYTQLLCRGREGAIYYISVAVSICRSHCLLNADTLLKHPTQYKQCAALNTHHIKGNKSFVFTIVDRVEPAQLQSGQLSPTLLEPA